MTTKIETNLTQLRADEITFTAFYNHTLTEWTSIAGRLMTRWSPPASIDGEDMVQEMLMRVPELIAAWSPDRGASLYRYVIFNAVAYAKRELHRHRCVSLHRPDAAPTRAPVPISSLPGTDEARTMDAVAEPAAPNQLVVEGVLDAMRLVQTDRERQVMVALIEAGTPGRGSFGSALYRMGTYDIAARRLIADGWPHNNTRASVARTARVFASRAASNG